MGTDTSDITERLTELLRAEVVGTKHGDVEVVEACVEAVTISEADAGTPWVKLEITVVLHTTNSGEGWAVHDVLTIRRLVGRLTATVELPSTVRFVPDEPPEDDSTRCDPDDEPLLSV